MHIYLTISSAVLLLLTSTSTLADFLQSQCANFDNIAMQLAFIQNKMHAPLDLEQIQTSLGAGNSENNSTATTYSWIYKDRILLVTTNGDSIANKMLTGNDDGSITSKKMEQIYTKLKSATSIWIIKEIKSQLGPGHSTSTQQHQYSWYCGCGSLGITTDQNNSIVAATISYNAQEKIIETRLGPNHPAWDIKTDSLGQAYRSWQRSFAS